MFICHVWICKHDLLWGSTRARFQQSSWNWKMVLLSVWITFGLMFGLSKNAWHFSLATGYRPLIVKVTSVSLSGALWKIKKAVIYGLLNCVAYLIHTNLCILCCLKAVERCFCGIFIQPLKQHSSPTKVLLWWEVITTKPKSSDNAVTA